MRRLRFPALITLIVFLLTACSAPRQTVTPAEATASTEALIRLETLPTTTLEPTPTRVVVNTPEPWKTQTPVPTATSLPSLTPILTIIPAVTPTATTPVKAGVKTLKQKNGSTIVSDFDNKFQFVAPSDWAVAVVENKSTPLGALSALQKDIPNASHLFSFLGMLTPEAVRFVGLDQSQVYSNTLYPVLMRVAVLQSPDKQITQSGFVDLLRKSLNQESYTVGKNDTKNFSNGIKAITLEVSEQFVVREGNNLVLVNAGGHLVIFQVANKWIIFSVAAPIKMIDKVAPMLDQMVGSIVLIK